MPVGFPTKVNYATGDVLSATNMNDLSGTVNLLESAQYAAGKNAIINGDFGIWQRGTSFTATGYTADRWLLSRNNTATVSQQTFTAGTAPVAGYEGQFFLRYSRTTGASSDYLIQKIEDVRTSAGQTITFSYWAKASSAVTLGATYFEQNFGSGGSATVATVNSSTSLTTSWQRFTVTVALPSIAGKTIGTNSFLAINYEFGSAMGASITVDIWGVQIEDSSVASPFQTSTGTKQGELAACQRYYEIGTTGYVGDARLSGIKYGAWSQFSVTKRTAPTMTVTSTAASGFNGTAVASDIYTNGFITAQNSSGVAGGTVFFFNSFTASSEL